MKRAPSGHRVGEWHPKCRLTDEQVRMMRQRYKPHAYGYEQLAREFHCGISTARDICTYRTRVSA